jgi:ABC-type antimicrobial peptide transport system permease subunit
MYALHLWKGVGQTFDVTDGHDQRLRLVVVGLLDNGILQGDLLIGPQSFLRTFPNTSGFRFFLVESPPDKTAAVRTALEDRLAHQGLLAQTTAERLAGFLAVQNTYLSTFQSLGGLGLVLGTFGLAAVQLRNVLERRGELAVLRAVGFPRRRLGRLVLLESSVLLLGGLATGLLAAAVAVLPHLLSGGATIPWLGLTGTLLIVLATGLLASRAAVRAAVRAPVVEALRESG